jgi:hypothetical protein
MVQVQDYVLLLYYALLTRRSCGAKRFFKNIFGAAAGPRDRKNQKLTMAALFLVLSYY